MELFLIDEIPKNIKNMIKDRFQEMDEPQENIAIRRINNPMETDLVALHQAPSMQRLMQQNPDLIPKPPQPVTPAAAQALAARQALLNSAGSEKPENGRRSPRKA